jgi:hypothetical protein
MSTNNTLPELHAHMPREQKGSQTGALYEYQYLQAAVASLDILNNPKSLVCVYCDWHDDYVVEEASTVYLFHQVKTRTIARGPWDILEFFEIKRRKQGGKNGSYPPASAKSIFAKMYDNYVRFGSRCQRFVFVIDNMINEEFSDLLADAQVATGPSNLNIGKDAFELIFAGVEQTIAGLTRQSFFDFLHRLEVREAVGKVNATRDGEHVLAGRIVDLSEIQVESEEARKIGAQLVSLVRRKSHAVLPEPPPQTVDSLRHQKGVSIDDLLEVLSLSRDGYEFLKSQGRDAILSVSRLQRLCRKRNTPDEIIKDMCRFKSQWDAWWLVERHRVEPTDAFALKNACLMLLRLHSDGKKELDEVVSESKSIAARFSTLGTTSPLTDSHVLGHIFSLWVEIAP